MHQLSSRHSLKHPIFSVFFSSQDNETSEITFGDVVKGHMASELFWVPVASKYGYWEVRVDDITLNHRRQSLCQDCRVVVDTGTSMLAGPSSIISPLRRLLNVTGDCSNYQQLPKLGFIIGGRILSLNPSDYVSRSQYGCSVSLMDLHMPPPAAPKFIFGIPFLERYYTVFDEPNSRIGFAVAQHKGHAPEVLVEAIVPHSQVAQVELDVNSQTDVTNNATVTYTAPNVQLKPQMESQADGSEDVLEVQTPLAEVEEPEDVMQSKSGRSSGFLAVAAPLAEPH
eukprot:CAMPEP_0172780186 /NCGR_PEP_ID=MMETSP1074-20121228/202801_1 /TAXON_ID=2916 /ORGANISM="Ceratium fusus, Strain PA161109" /LENGTH=282 /DNA_ID=CAMNT_0013617159 /DNA_START=1 /DNA_END=849 /DNA_ORIENTATION=-